MKKEYCIEQVCLEFNRMIINSLIAILVVAAYGLIYSERAFAGYKATFTPKISIKQEYTGNVFFNNENTEEDFITTISPGFDLEFSDQSKGVKLTYMPGPSFYSTNSDNDTLRHDVSFSGWIQLSRTTQISIYDTFKYTEDPLSDPEDLIFEPSLEDDAEESIPSVQDIMTEEQISTDPDTTRRRGREVYYSNTAGIAINQQIGKTDTLSIGYAYSILENDDPDALDSARHNTRIGYMHPFSRFLDISLNGSYEIGDFSGEADDFDNYKLGFTLTKRFTKFISGNLRYQHTVANFDGQTGDYQIYDPSIGIGYSFSKNASVSLNAGYFLQDRQDSEDESGLSLDGNIGKAWEFKRGSINVSGSSGYGESYFGAENLGFNTYYQAHGSGSYSFSKTLTGSIFGSFRQNDYVNLDSDRKDDLITAGFRLAYNPVSVKWLKVGFTYTFRKMDSSEDDNDYEEDRVLLNITLAPDHTIRLN